MERMIYGRIQNILKLFSVNDFEELIRGRKFNKVQVYGLITITTIKRMIRGMLTISRRDAQVNKKGVENDKFVTNPKSDKKAQLGEIFLTAFDQKGDEHSQK